MESNDKDIWRQLFADMPDETLPTGFNEKIMGKVMAKAALREKTRKFFGIFGYALGCVAMAVTCFIVFIYYDVSIELPKFAEMKIELPKLELLTRSFHKPDYGLLHSPSFHLSLFIGIAALFLLIVDSTIRSNIEKSKKKQ